MIKNVLITLSICTLTMSAVQADGHKDGFKNLEHLGTTLGGAADNGFRELKKGVDFILGLPDDTKHWTIEQVQDLKDKICDKPVTIIKETIKEVPVEIVKEVVKEVPVEVVKEVEKIVYVDKIIEVPAKPRERQCTTQRKSDRFGNVEEKITCTEWK